MIFKIDAVIAGAGVLIQVTRTLGRPVLVTEQYPKAFKRTVNELAQLLRGSAGEGEVGEGQDPETADRDTPLSNVVEKKLFSMAVPEVLAQLESSGTRNVALVGIESHICVTQTALDLLGRGYGVYVMADSVSSQRSFDRSVALERLRSAGAVVTTVESFVFEALKSADHPKFKAVSAILREYHPETHGLSSL